MRLPRVRFTLRSMMVAMAVLGIVLWVTEVTSFQHLAQYHSLWSEADIICCDMLVTDDGKQTPRRNRPPGRQPRWLGVTGQSPPPQIRESGSLSVAPDPARPE